MPKVQFESVRIANNLSALKVALILFAESIKVRSAFVEIACEKRYKR